MAEQEKHSPSTEYENPNTFTEYHQLAEIACAHRKMCGVYCSWSMDYGASALMIKARITYIKQDCLPPGIFDGTVLPYEGWFLKLFETETEARDFYKQCHGDDSGQHDGVYAVLIDNTGKTRTENT